MSRSAATAAKPEQPQPALSFARSDVEKRLGLPAGRFTQAGPVLPIFLGALLTIAVYAALSAVPDLWIAETLTQRGYVPYFIVFFTSWALMILFVKRRKVRLQRQAVHVGVLPDDPTFVISDDSADHVIERLHDVADDPGRFLLLNRIHIALSNLRNIGQVADVDQVLRSQAESDEAVVESSYTVVRGLIWAIPVLGFIGTVIGLSGAIGSFGDVLSKANELDALKPALRSVTGGLATAFETTLQGLVGALVLQLVLTMTKRSEEQMLDEFMEYCQRRIVHRLRLAGRSESEGGDEPAASRE